MKVSDYKGYEIDYSPDVKEFQAWRWVEDERGRSKEFVAGAATQAELEKKLDELGKRKFKRFPAVWMGTHYGVESPLQGFVTSMKETRSGYPSRSSEVIVFSYKTNRAENAHMEVSPADLYEATPENIKIMTLIQDNRDRIALAESEISAQKRRLTGKLTRDRILELGAKA